MQIAVRYAKCQLQRPKLCHDNCLQHLKARSPWRWQPDRCRDHHITQAFDSSTRPSAPSRAEVEDDSVIGYGFHWIYDAPRRWLTSYHRCTEFNCLEATWHGMAIGQWNHHLKPHPIFEPPSSPQKRSWVGYVRWTSRSISEIFAFDLTCEISACLESAWRASPCKACQNLLATARLQSHYSTHFNNLLPTLTLYSCYIALHHAKYHIISHPFISTDCHLALSFQATAAGAAHGMHLQSSSRPTSGTNLQDVHGRFRCHPYDPIWCPTSPRLWQALISATSAGKLSQIIQYMHIISIYTS